MNHRQVSKCNRPHQQGVTLVELVISIVLISIAMVALINAFSVSMLASTDSLWRNKTLKLAQLYIDEILAKNYDHATPVGGIPAIASPSCSALGADGAEDRDDFNDVDDYDGIKNETPLSLIASLDSSYSEYRVSIDVTCSGDAVGAVNSSNVVASNQAKKITVTIKPPGEDAISFSVYKANF